MAPASDDEQDDEEKDQARDGVYDGQILIRDADLRQGAALGHSGQGIKIIPAHQPAFAVEDQGFAHLLALGHRRVQLILIQTEFRSEGLLVCRPLLDGDAQIPPDPHIHLALLAAPDTSDAGHLAVLHDLVGLVFAEGILPKHHAVLETGGAVRAVQGDHDELRALAFGVAHVTESRAGGESGLDALAAFVFEGDLFPVHFDGLLIIPKAGVAVDQGPFLGLVGGRNHVLDRADHLAVERVIHPLPGDQGQVSGGGVVQPVGVLVQAVGIAEHRVFGAAFLRPFVHHVGEFIDVTVCHGQTQYLGRVIAGFQHHAVQQMLHTDLLPRFQPHGAAGCLHIFRHRDHLIQVQPLHRQKQCQDLGDAGRLAGQVRVLLVEHRSGIRVHDDGGLAVDGGSIRLINGDGREHDRSAGRRFRFLRPCERRHCSCQEQRRDHDRAYEV